MEGHIPIRYVPKSLTKKDRIRQKKNILKSRKQYKQHKYIPRPLLKSFHSRRSGHVATAKRVYQMDAILPNAELARKTGCTRKALQKIVNKGEGAYYSSGSRPNQTAKSWGLARLASAITGGPASRIDSVILEEGCTLKKTQPFPILKNKYMK